MFSTVPYRLAFIMDMHLRKKQNTCRLQVSTVQITAKQTILYHINTSLNE